MPLPFLQYKYWHSAGPAAPAVSAGCDDQEQAVIELSPTAWWDASYSGAALKDDGAGGFTEASSGEDVSKFVTREGSSFALLQATASKQPIFLTDQSDFNGNSVIQFDAEADTMLLGPIHEIHIDTDAEVGTIFYVGKELDPHNTGNGAGDGANPNGRVAGWTHYGSASIITNEVAGASISLYTPAVLSAVDDGSEFNPYMVVVKLDTASSFMSYNGATNVDFTAGVHMTYHQGYTHLGGYNSVNENTSTSAAEYIIFDTALSDENIAVVVDYLVCKYTAGAGFI